MKHNTNNGNVIFKLFTGTLYAGIYAYVEGVIFLSLWSMFRRKTEAERKRDEYYKLYTRLSDVLEEHDRRVNDATGAYESYHRSLPYLSHFKVPSNDFVVKREQLNEKLTSYFDEEKGKRLDLVIAINRAYGRYEYYRSLAITEAENYEREKNKGD